MNSTKASDDSLNQIGDSPIDGPDEDLSYEKLEEEAKEVNINSYKLKKSLNLGWYATESVKFIKSM